MRDSVEDGDSGLLDPVIGRGVYGGAYFTLRHRLFRGIWNLAWLLLASWTPPPMHAWRRFLLRLFGAKIGQNTRIWGSTRIWYPPNLEMGDYAVLGWKVNCYCQGKVTLKPYATVSQYSHLVTGSHDFDDPNFPLFTRPIIVGESAWVASSTIVGPGVTVGDGAVLGAGSVAFKDLEAWTVYVGNPAKPIRKRKVLVRR